MSQISERTYQLFMGMSLAFIMLMFDETLGRIFLALLFVGGIAYILDKHISLPFEKAGNNRIISFVYSLIALGGFYVLSSLALYLFDFTKNLLDINSVLSLYAQYTPIFAGSAAITYLAYGLIIPMIETPLFFGRVAEWIFDWLGVSSNLNIFNKLTWAVPLIMGVIFAGFHLSAKFALGSAGMSSALLAVFVFGVVSTIVVIIFKQTLEATIMHILANSIAITMSQGIAVTLNALMYVAGGVLIFVLLSKSVKITRSV